MGLHTDSNIETVCSNMWQWQEHKKPLLALRKKDMPKLVGVLFHLYSQTGSSNLQKTLCVGYFCNEV